jgi:hypothetical protein
VRGHQTQWAAQFAVASELCKRGYEVSFTMGHSTPVADLMVVSPSAREMFLVDVKGLHKRNPWIVKRKAPRANLFYILAYVPTAEPNQFFIMSQEDVSAAIRDELQRLGRPDDYRVTGLIGNSGCRMERLGTSSRCDRDEGQGDSRKSRAFERRTGPRSRALDAANFTFCSRN